MVTLFFCSFEVVVIMSLCYLLITHKLRLVFVDSRNLSKYDDMHTDSNAFAVIDIVGTLVPLIMCGVLFQHCQDSYH